MSHHLSLDEFPPASPEDWRAAAEEVLDGAPFERKLVSRTPEGIPVQPIYHSPAADSGVPGFAPFERGGRALPLGWDIAQEIPAGSAKAFNNALRTDLERGQTAVFLTLDRASRLGLDPDEAVAGDVAMCGTSLWDVGTLGRALDGVDPATTPVFIETGAAGLPFAALFAGWIEKSGKHLALAKGGLLQDPIAELIAEGTLPHDAKTAFDLMATAVKWGIARAPGLQSIGVRTHAIHDGGANAVQELASALAAGACYLRELATRGIDPAAVLPRIRFGFSVGPDFFMAIAKLRAFRKLWVAVGQAFGAPSSACAACIHARTSLWNRSFLDPHTNMLRATTEALAAVLGGCDSLHVGAFDEVIRPPDEFSRRIARNTQIILRDECGTHRVVDPAGGSGYVESLTDDLCAAAWKSFQDIEARGGILAALADGSLQKSVADVAAKRADAVATRRESQVGVNRYANPSETLLEMPALDPAALRKKEADAAIAHRDSASHATGAAVLDKLNAILDADPEALLGLAAEAAALGATLGEISKTLRARGGPPLQTERIPLRRVASGYEALRLAVAAQSERPKAFLANMGPLSQYKARADFSAGFLEAGGFEIIDRGGFASPEDAAQAALESGASTVVICSTDATYPDIVPPLAAALKAANPAIAVVLAGFPADHIESFKAAGVDEFIHLRANCLEVLRNLLRRVGIIQ